MNMNKKKSPSIWIPVVVVVSIILSISLFFIKITVIDSNTYKNNIIKGFNDNKKNFEIVRNSLFNDDIKMNYKNAEEVKYKLDSVIYDYLNDCARIEYVIFEGYEVYHTGIITLNKQENDAFNKIKELYHYGMDYIVLQNNDQIYFGCNMESYVYTMNGEEPSGNLEFDNRECTNIKLDDHWYFLKWKNIPR